MNDPLLQYVNKRAQNGIDIGKTVDLFRRYAFIEQACVRALAGWFIKVYNWEAKIELGYHLFAQAERANDILERMEELRGGNRHVNIEPNFDRVAEELVNAPDELSFISGIGLILRRLVEQYNRHIGASDASANALEIRILQRHIPDIERQLKEIDAMAPKLRSHDSNAKQIWVNYLESLLTASGGIDGLADKSSEVAQRPDSSRFEWPIPMAFDDRLVVGELGTYESKKDMAMRDRCIGEFEVYFNEFYAAAILATIIYESWKISAPRQYFMDIAHHFWDEVRHAEFGAIRLREIGVEPNKVNMILFDLSHSMPLLHRLCHLTLGLEVFFMPRKTERVKYYEEQGDHRSQLFADVDWSEEVNHVRYGKRWVEHFLKDDSRTVEDLQAEIAEYVEKFSTKLPEGRKAPW